MFGRVTFWTFLFTFYIYFVKYESNTNMKQFGVGMLLE